MALFSVHSLSRQDRSSIDREKSFLPLGRQTTTRNDDSIFSSAPRCSGVLVYWNKERKKKTITHVYRKTQVREKSVIKVLVKFGENSRHSSRPHRDRFPDRWASTRALLLFTRALRSIVRSSVLENIEIPNLARKAKKPRRKKKEMKGKEKEKNERTEKYF